MSPEKTELLFSKYPELFRGRQESEMRNLMCFGFECGDGWFNLIDSLSSTIQRLAETAKLTGETFPKAAQVKEKFGTLRFYCDHATREILDAIDEFEKLSATVCEECGREGKLYDKKGWFKTLCVECANRLGYHASDAAPPISFEVRMVDLKDLKVMPRPNAPWSMDEAHEMWVRSASDGHRALWFKCLDCSLEYQVRTWRSDSADLPAHFKHCPECGHTHSFCLRTDHEIGRICDAYAT